LLLLFLKVDTTIIVVATVFSTVVFFANKKCQTDLFFHLFRLFVPFVIFVNFFIFFCGGGFSRQKLLISKKKI